MKHKLTELLVDGGFTKAKAPIWGLTYLNENHVYGLRSITTGLIDFPLFPELIN